MVDYGATISLSRGLSHSSEDGSSELSPGSGPNLSTPVNDDVPTPPPAKRRKASGSDEYQNLQSPVQTARKVRGRPPGSKNKPKPPVIITRDSEFSMKPAILEISAGCDIIESIINFARRNHVGVSVISATGSVSNVTIRNPVSYHHHTPSHPAVSNVTIRNPVPHHSPAPLFFRGPVTLLALSGSFFGSFATTQSGLPSSSPSSSSSSLGPVHACSSFGVSLAGVQGHVFGGIVAGKMVAAAPVMVVAATFLNPTFHMLPAEINEADKDVDIMPSLGGAGAAAAADGSAIERCASTGMSSMPAYAASSAAPISCPLPSHQIMQWGPPGRPPF